jgi:hypothetical protein
MSACPSSIVTDVRLYPSRCTTIQSGVFYWYTSHAFLRVVFCSWFQYNTHALNVTARQEASAYPITNHIFISCFSSLSRHASRAFFPLAQKPDRQVWRGSNVKVQECWQGGGVCKFADPLHYEFIFNRTNIDFMEFAFWILSKPRVECMLNTLISPLPCAIFTSVCLFVVVWYAVSLHERVGWYAVQKRTPSST